MSSHPNHTPRTYDIMRDGNDGYGVQDEDGCFINKEPFDTYRDAELFLEQELSDAA